MTEAVRVLIVEDSATDAELVVHELARSGLTPCWTRVESENDYLEAIEKPFDVILSDYSVPGFGAERALELLRERGIDLPFLVVSGTVGEETAVAMMRKGAADYLLKDRLTRLGAAVARATAEHRLRQEHRQAQEAVRQTEERYRVLVELSPEAVALVDDGRIAYVNAAGAELLGAATPETIVGREVHDFLEPSAIPGSRRLREASGDASPLRRQQVLRRLDGRLIDVEISAAAVRLYDRVATQIVAHDVTAERRRDRELREALHQARETDRLKTLFLATMSHEIRTPLNVILGSSGLVQEHLEESGDRSQSDLLRGIEEAGHRLLRTISSVLDIARIEAGAFDLHVEEIDVVDAVAPQRLDFELRARRKGLDCDWRMEAPAARVSFDRYCLQQALANLLENALKFTERGCVSVRLWRDGDDRLRLDVRDTGIGIDAQYLPDLFQPFSQEDSGYTRRFEGSGLGLALARRYVELNAGSLSVESRKGWGSIFTVRFPTDPGRPRD